MLYVSVSPKWCTEQQLQFIRKFDTRAWNIDWTFKSIGPVGGHVDADVVQKAMSKQKSMANRVQKYGGFVSTLEDEMKRNQVGVLDVEDLKLDKESTRKLLNDIKDAKSPVRKRFNCSALMIVDDREWIHALVPVPGGYHGKGHEDHMHLLPVLMQVLYKSITQCPIWRDRLIFRFDGLGKQRFVPSYMKEFFTELLQNVPNPDGSVPNPDGSVPIRDGAGNLHDLASVLFLVCTVYISHRRKLLFFNNYLYQLDVLLFVASLPIVIAQTCAQHEDGRRKIGILLPMSNCGSL